MRKDLGEGIPVKILASITLVVCLISHFISTRPRGCTKREKRKAQERTKPQATIKTQTKKDPFGLQLFLVYLDLAGSPLTWSRTKGETDIFTGVLPICCKGQVPKQLGGGG